MIFPEPLQKNDTIAIISTARKITVEELSFGKQWLEDLGFNVIFGTSIGLSHHQFAGTSQERANDLQQQINNPKIKAIWCARGGYGTVRIIDLLDFSPLQKQPKWIIGYSDVTVLHSHLHRLGFASIHGPLAFDIKKTALKAQRSLAKTLLGKENHFSFNPSSKNRLGKASGIAVGGNLSILHSLCGSPSAINTAHKILFIEDLDEYLYHIDRMLQNLDRNGLFKNLAGLVVGGMTSMHDNTIPFGISVEEMILQITSKYNYPVVFEAPFGHISDNKALVFGKKISLNVTKNKVCIN